MSSINVFLSGNGPVLTTQFSEEIALDEKFTYSCCLLDFCIQLDQLQVTFTNENNVFEVVLPGSTKSINRTVMYTASYNLEYIARLLEERHGSTSPWNFKLDEDSMKYSIETSEKNLFLFSKPSSVGKVFGFMHTDLEGQTTYKAQYRQALPNIQNIRVKCDMVGHSNVLYEFHAESLSNYKMIEQPHVLIYSPIDKRRINSIEITVTDENDKPIHIANGKIYCRLNIKKD